VKAERELPQCRSSRYQWFETRNEDVSRERDAMGEMGGRSDEADDEVL
jgi:hypothetical protein